MAENVNGDIPVFNTGEQSYGSMRRLVTMQAAAMRIQAQMRQLARDPESVDYRDIPSPEEMDQVYDSLDAHLSEVLVSVPPDWLVEGAPEDLDWSEPESLRYVRADKIQALREAMRIANDPESVTGK